jgi:thioredoxin 1
MTLYTNLEHIAKEADFNNAIEENENVMICCGRMGPMCIPVLGEMEQLREEYTHVKFLDLLFDNPDSHVITRLPEVSGFMGLPFTVYFKNGKVVKATGSIQSKDQIKEILDSEF